MDSLDCECTHVIQTRQEYEMLLNQRDRAKRDKEEAERAAAREISRVKQEAAHEADRAAQRAQAQIDDLFTAGGAENGSNRRPARTKCEPSQNFAGKSKCG